MTEITLTEAVTLITSATAIAAMSCIVGYANGVKNGIKRGKQQR